MKTIKDVTTEASETPRVPRDKRANQRDLAAERTRAEILQIAVDEFASHGYTGARVDAIAERMRTSKGMIYYYFTNKEGLYTAVLEHVYSLIRDAEEATRIDLDTPAEDLLRAYIENTFEFHERNLVFSRIISIENIHNADFLKRSPTIKATNRPVLDTLKNILERGVEAGTFRGDVTPVELHYLISALCIYRVSNRQTFGTLFDVDFASKKTRARQKTIAVEAVMKLLAL
ncbi:AcrR family transcriptional regulator [Paraburkholderia sp. GAS199]|uniref:TetR family transcriptional regulator n=1 Tax=Paraburkholderia sp. GAS199 TaxID=3035126 RepID=UPI003D1F14ED